MKIHIPYSWINLRGTNPPYRNTLNIITYACDQSNFFSQNQGEGVQPPLPKFRRGCDPPPSPTLALLYKYNNVI